MFVTVKQLAQRIDNEIYLIGINIEVLEGKLDNPNGYSREYILEFINKQVKTVYNLVDELERISANKKLIAQYRVKAKEVGKRFSEI